eukprot:gene240-436_t
MSDVNHVTMSFLGAIMRGNIEGVKELVESGKVDVNDFRQGWSFTCPMREAVYNDRFEIFKYLVTHSTFDGDAVTPTRIRTILRIVLRKMGGARIRYLRILFQHPRFDLYLKDDDGKYIWETDDYISAALVHGIHDIFKSCQRKRRKTIQNLVTEAFEWPEDVMEANVLPFLFPKVPDQ